MLINMYKLFIILLTITQIYCNECSTTKETCQRDVNQRYLFYDVNPPEGFNLRRDVYMRFAKLAKTLAESKDPQLNKFKLVLPPWSNLYHWQSASQPEFIPWSLFFDLNSLKKFAPVIEMHKFFSGNLYKKGIKIDEVYVLQHFKDMFETQNFQDRMLIDKCQRKPQTNYFFYHNVSSENVRCLSFHGSALKLIPILKNSTAKTVLFDHGEVALHDRFGDSTYWQCRRSMRFNEDLEEIAAEYRSKFLGSNDISDNTIQPTDWKKEKPKRDAIGGPYLAVHLRRRDFVWGRSEHIPDIENAAEQISQLANELNLETVFVATDADEKEYEELKEILLWRSIKTVRFKPNKEIKKAYKDGGVAVIEQIICSHARYFLGTYESTFSFRIQEEREILGFNEGTTFNRLCGNKEVSNCSRPSIWKIVHDEL